MRYELHFRRALLPAFVAAALALSGCGKPSGTTTASGGGTIHLDNPGPAVETINGEEVPVRLVDAIIHQRNWEPTRPDLRERALKEVTNIVLTAQAAKKENFLSDPDFEALVELGRLQALSNATAAAFRERAPFDEAAAKADYENRVVAGGKPDYDFTQIVMRSEAEAKKVMAELKSRPFDKVVEAHQKDALQTRSLKHVRGAQLPAPLATALDELKPGEVAKEPVKSPLGFVILRLDGITPYTPPPFEQVRDNMKRQAQKKAGEEQLAKLRAEARIVPAPGMAPVQPNTLLPQPPAHQPPAQQPARPAEAKPAGDEAKPQN
jgi:peptidyl-prolyl cis-trans isomerase C